MPYPTALKSPPSQALDFMRGLALLGMLISQAQTQAGFAWLRPHPMLARPLEQADIHTPTQFFIALLVNGPAQALFSLGFGWSFYRLWQTSQLAGLQADQIVRRHLWALLGLGLLASWVGGFGELLPIFALLGFSLLYFSRQSVTTLLRWIAGLTAFGVLTQLLHPLVFSESTQTLADHCRPTDAFVSPLVHSWLVGGCQQVMASQSVALLMRQGRVLQQGLTPYVHIEIMLLGGLLAGKLSRLDRRAELRVRLSLLLLVVFPLAIGLKGAVSLWVVEVAPLPARWQAYAPGLASLCAFVGTPLLTLVYVLEIGLNLTHNLRSAGFWISQVGQVGQMSLSNYLLQSGLSRLVFEEAGLGLSGKLSLLASVGVALLIYSLQLWVSHWWLSRYRQGPVEEWLDRWTYRRRVAKPSAPARTG